MKRINVYTVAEEILENFYATVEDRDAKWPYVMLKTALGLASTKNNEQDRVVIMAVKALGTLSEVERETFLNEFEIAPIVERNLDTTYGWPDMLPVYDYEPITSEDVEQFRIYALDRVNYLAGRERLKLITNIPGQEMLYIQKEAEALDYIAQDPEPTDMANYPFLEAEVGITAPTALEVAQVYANLSAIFKATGASLENARLGAIAVIETAEDTATMEATLDAYVTGLAAAAA